MINAINMPNEIISAKAFAMSIGKHLPPREVSQRRLTTERQCHPTPHAKLVYCIRLYHILVL